MSEVLTGSDNSDTESDEEVSHFGKTPTRFVGTHHFGRARTQHSSQFVKIERTLGISFAALLMLVAWLLYLTVAMIIRPDRSWPLALFSVICLLVFILNKTGYLDRLRARMPSTPILVRWAVLGILAVIMIVIVCFQIIPDSPHRHSRLQSLFGSVVFVTLCALMSWHMKGIPWDVILAGALFQFFLGFFVMRTETGMNFFKNAGDAVKSFLSFSDKGAEFVFGPDYGKVFFAFKVLPTTIYFSAFISAMYYLGVMQITVRIIALFLKKTIGSRLIQSVNAAGNLFLGQTEAPLLIKPMLPNASPCDIHCVMVGGFASIAGGVLAAYIRMGVSADQLMGASVMSVPGTLVVSNLVCPPGSMKEEEVLPSVKDEEDQTSSDESDDNDEFDFPPSSENNIIEAAGNGAHIAIDLVLNIGAMLIAFVSLLALMNHVLGHLGENVGVPQLSFELICSYVFWPIAWLLGAPSDDCFELASLIGTKIFVNEFMAYLDLSKLIDPQNRQISERGELVATYALCGFSNIGSIGVQLGCLTSLCPDRKRVFAKLVVSAMISGNVVCFLTATIAGILN